MAASIGRLHQEETGQVVENQGNSGLIEADDAIEVEFDKITKD